LKAVKTGLGRQRLAEESKTLARSDKDGAAPASHMPGCDCRRVRERAEDTAGLDARASTDLSLFTRHGT
jgi:hypothetical protein